ncbi:salicylate hydroxylase [Mycena rebaudengoi]|nr:salicylate hydroxylase [Mycena rebaudengoi]
MKPLTVVILGAGIGGLQTALALAADGHKVTVLESAKEFLEVTHRISGLAWGVDLDSVKEMSRGNRFVDWHGTRLLDCPFDDVHTRYDAPYYFIHRSDIIDALVAAVDRQNNITLRMDTPVVDYDFEAPTVTTTTSSVERLAADLVICADGIKSAVRSAVNGRPVDPVDTGDVAYRILVPAAPLLADPRCATLMGPEGHALYNVIIDVTHRTDLGVPIALDEWRSEADNMHLMERFVDWCPEVQKLCALTGKYLKWKLADFAELQPWGAAEATEDAAALAVALRAHDHDISAALRAYEAQRKPRAAEELMRHDSPDNPIFWACSERRDYGHDATKLNNEAIPALPPMPDPVVSVYKGREEL